MIKTGNPVIIKLRLEGALQSWGNNSRWDYRGTNLIPTKSAVVGILGCAFGYPRNDVRLEVLARELKVGFRVEEQGTILRDYHTVSGFLPTAAGSYRYDGIKVSKNLKMLQDTKAKPSTVQSYRDYIADGAFLVVFTTNNDELLTACIEALKKPKWPQFLGRKCCVPSRPIYDGFTEDYTDLTDALLNIPYGVQRFCFQVKRSGNELNKKKYSYVECDAADYRSHSYRVIEVQDSPVFSQDRLFEFTTYKVLE